VESFGVATGRENTLKVGGGKHLRVNPGDSTSKILEKKYVDTADCFIFVRDVPTAYKSYFMIPPASVLSKYVKEMFNKMPLSLQLYKHKSAPVSHPFDTLDECSKLQARIDTHSEGKQA